MHEPALLFVVPPLYPVTISSANDNGISRENFRSADRDGCNTRAEQVGAKQTNVIRAQQCYGTPADERRRRGRRGRTMENVNDTTVDNTSWQFPGASKAPVLVFSPEFAYLRRNLDKRSVLRRCSASSYAGLIKTAFVKINTSR